MPTYDLICKKKHTSVEYLTFQKYDRVSDGSEEVACHTCGERCVPIAANLPVFYGAWRINDKTFRDAEEATGETIKSTKDIDRLEKAGVIRAVTNPSTYQFKNGKKLGKL